jgi:hypothetical protein
MEAIIATKVGKDNMFKKVSNLIVIYSDKSKTEKIRKESENIKSALFMINDFWQKFCDLRRKNITEETLEKYLDKKSSGSSIADYKWICIRHDCFYQQPFSEKILKLEKIKRRISFGIENESPLILSDEEISTIS